MALVEYVESCLAGLWASASWLCGSTSHLSSRSKTSKLVDIDDLVMADSAFAQRTGTNFEDVSEPQQAAFICDVGDRAKDAWLQILRYRKLQAVVDEQLSVVATSQGAQGIARGPTSSTRRSNFSSTRILRSLGEECVLPVGTLVLVQEDPQLLSAAVRRALEPEEDVWVPAVVAQSGSLAAVERVLCRAAGRPAGIIGDAASVGDLHYAQAPGSHAVRKCGVDKHGQYWMSAADTYPNRQIWILGRGVLGLSRARGGAREDVVPGSTSSQISIS